MRTRYKIFSNNGIEDNLFENHREDGRFKNYIEACVDLIMKTKIPFTTDRDILEEIVEGIFDKAYRKMNRIDEHSTETIVAEHKVRELKKEKEFLVYQNETQRHQIRLLEYKIHNLLEDKKDLEKEVAELKERIKRATSVWAATDAAAMEMFE